MANITTPYLSGTITAISDDGLTLTLDTDIHTGDSGKIIFMTDGDGIRNYRRFTYDGISALNTINLDEPFGESPFRSIDSLRTGTKFTEGDIAVGDAFSISYAWADLASNADITLSNSNQFVDITGGTQLSSGVVIYDENVTVQWEYSTTSNIRISSGAAVILGRQHFGNLDDDDVLGYTSNSCRVIDTSTGTGSSENPGTFHMNGGTYEVSGTRTFLRFNDGDSNTNDAAQNFRMWNVKVYGGFGARISGDQSVMLNTEGVGNTGSNGTLGLANPIRPGIFLNCASRDARQGIYHFPATAGNVTVEAFDIQDIDTTVIRIDTGGSPSNNTLTLNNWSFPDLTAATASGTNVDTFQRTVNRAAHQIRFTKDVEFTVVNVDGTSPNDANNDGRVLFRDAFAALTIDSDNNGGGLFPAINLLGRDAVTSTVLNFGSFDDTDFFDVYTPYDYAIKYRNHNLLLGNTSFDTGSGAFTQTLTRTLDVNITDTDLSSVDAYTDLGTAARVYDYADKFKNENMTLPTPLEQYFTKSADVLTFTQENVNVEMLSTLTPVFAYLGDLVENDRDLTPQFTGNTQVSSVDRDEIIVTTGNTLDDNAITSLQSADWDEWANNYLWINLNEDADATESFLENARSHGNITVDETILDGSATFTLATDADIFTAGNAKGILLGDIEAQTGNGPQLASQICRVEYQEDTRLCIKTPASGYADSIILDGGNLTVDTEIQGQVVCADLLHSFVPGDRIINTSESVDATITLDGGEYFIDDADISNLTINRTAGDTDTVTVTNNENVSGNPTLGTGVQLNLVLDVTINGPAATDGRLSFYESDGTLITDTEGTTLAASIVDFPTLSNMSNPIWVWSGPGYVDVRGTAEVLFGTNVFTETPLVKRYQDFSSDEPNPVVSNDTDVIDTDTDYALIHITGATGADVFTDGSFNYFANTKMVGTPAYNEVIARDENALHAISSSGSTGTAIINATYVRVTPGEDATQLLGFITNDADNDDSLTIDRVSGAFTFECLIPASALTVDTAQLEIIYRDIADDQTTDIKGDNSSVNLTSLRKSIFAASQL